MGDDIEEDTASVTGDAVEENDVTVSDFVSSDLGVIKVVNLVVKDSSISTVLITEDVCFETDASVVLSEAGD